MRRAHTLIGWLFVLVFLGTGAWMRMSFPAAFQEDDGLHMMFRAGHIYILFTALLNLAASLLRPVADHGIGSALRIAAPFVLVSAFFLELAPRAFDRPLSRLGVISAALGTLLIWLGSPRAEPARERR